MNNSLMKRYKIKFAIPNHHTQYNAIYMDEHPGGDWTNWHAAMNYAEQEYEKGYKAGLKANQIDKEDAIARAKSIKFKQDPSEKTLAESQLHCPTCDGLKDENKWCSNSFHLRKEKKEIAQKTTIGSS